MIRLHVIAEGQTEETFVNKVLVWHLAERDISAGVRMTDPVGASRRTHKGGVLDYDRARKDILRWTKEDQNPDARFTTMFDLYALPPDYPGSERASRERDPYKRVAVLEAALAADIGDPRVIPYVQLYEFEALVLVDPGRLEVAIELDDCQVAALAELAVQCESPELVDDGETTAPSKRVIAAAPDYAYRKASAGPAAAAAIGLATLRARCPHFHEWVTKLEALSG